MRIRQIKCAVYKNPSYSLVWKAVRENEGLERRGDERERKGLGGGEWGYIGSNLSMAMRSWDDRESISAAVHAARLLVGCSSRARHGLKRRLPTEPAMGGTRSG